MRSGTQNDVNVSTLKLYHNATLYKEKMLGHVLSPETKLTGYQLVKLAKFKSKIAVHTRNLGIPKCKAKFETVKQAYKDMHELALKFL